MKTKEIRSSRSSKDDDTDVDSSQEISDRPVFHQIGDLRYNAEEAGYNWKNSVPYDELFAEKLDGERHELWLFVVPQSLDVRSLHGSKINLEGSTTVNSKDGEDSYEFCALGRSHAKLENTSIILPDEKKSKTMLSNYWMHGFSGQLTAIKAPETTKNNEVTGSFCQQSPTSKAKVPFPTGLKQRYTPFGAQEPMPTSPRRKRKKKVSKRKKKEEEKWKEGKFGCSTPRLDNGQRSSSSLHFRDDKDPDLEGSDIEAPSLDNLDEDAPEINEEPRKERKKLKNKKRKRDEDEAEERPRSKRKKKKSGKSERETQSTDDTTTQESDAAVRKSKKKRKAR